MGTSVDCGEVPIILLHIIEKLGIDMTRAFDTIRRDKLLSVLHSFLDTDNVRIIRLLLSDTNISVSVDDALFAPFNTTVGTPQGDSLSPVIFTVYLDAALRTLHGYLHADHQSTLTYPAKKKNANAIDYISTNHEYMSKVNENAPAALGECRH